MKNQKHNGVGRPKATINWPNKRFTFMDLQTANPKLSILTLRNALKRDAVLKAKSTVVRLDEKRTPNNEEGLGRKVFVFVKRSLQRNARNLRSARKTVSISMAPTPTPAPVAVSIPITAPAPAPVAIAA